MRKILLFIATIPLMLLASSSRADVQYVYLGGAYDMNHCVQIARANYFGYATMGGYVNGIFYWNACYGSNYQYPQPRPQPNPNPGPNPSVDRIDDAVAQLHAATNYLRTAVLNNEAYGALRPYAIAMVDDVGYLGDAVDAGSDMLVIRRRFEHVNGTFSRLEDKYIELYAANRDRGVEDAWGSVESAFVKLVELLR